MWNGSWDPTGVGPNHADSAGEVNVEEKEEEEEEKVVPTVLGIVLIGVFVRDVVVSEFGCPFTVSVAEVKQPAAAPGK